MAKLYDALIIGGGPAGLSVALGLGRQSRSCLVLSDKTNRNNGVEASHATLALDHVHPQQILSQARQQIARYDNTEYAEVRIESAEKLDDEFRLRSTDGRSFRGRSLVLAAGVRDIFPKLEGYAENWPQNIYQCLFCDGWDRRESHKAILALDGVGPHEINNASMAFNQDTDSALTILNNGPLGELEKGLAKKLKALQARGLKVDERKVVKVEDAAPYEGIYAYLEENGKVEKVLFGYLVHKPPTELKIPSILEQLGIDTEAGVFGKTVKPGTMGATNVEGVFAAGDCVNVMTNVPNSIASGIVAAAGVTFFLNGRDDEHGSLAVRS